MNETAAFVTILAGFLPALSARLPWIAGLSILSVLVLWQGTEVCGARAQGFEGLGCAFALIIGGTFAVASLCVGLVRMRYRLRGAETALGRPWIAALAIYSTAIVGFVLFVYWMSID